MENLFETKQELITKIKDAEDRHTNKKSELKKKEKQI